MKAINVYIADETHCKLSELKKSLGKSNLADVITSIIERCYLDSQCPAETDLETSISLG